MMLRPLLVCLMAVTLALTGHSMAIARGASAATGQMVICFGETMRIVHTDAEGQPTSAPLICPDAALQAPVTAPSPALSLVGNVRDADLGPALQARAVPGSVSPVPHSRAPPSLPV